ncbi:MAG: DUF1992 domain-containing protein [Verrucomicrobiales bacterium]|nr:DUF1992 domain-containing protein [Verrucomicrobiales bacterium]
MSWSGPIAEKISEAIKNGNLTQPEDLKGKKVDLDAYFATPHHLRMGYSILASSGFHPLEVDILKQMEKLEKKIAAGAEQERLEELKMEFNSLTAKLNLPNRR